MRAFVAVELPSDVNTALADLVEVLNQAGIRGLRPVRTYGIHLTLKFLGDVPAGRLGHVTEELVRVCQAHSPFTLRLAGAGGFPTGGSPRILWVGLDGEVERLRVLQRRLDASLVPMGFASERREFGPHLTVARVRDGTPDQDRQKAAEVLHSVWTPPELAVPVNGLNLMRSTLRPSGAIYDRLASAPLAADSPGEGPG